MCGVMSFTMLSVFSLLAEQTLTLPPVQAGGTALVHAQFRTLVPAPAPQTEVKRLLAEDSPFEIPEPAAPEKKVEPEVAPEPKVAATPKPAPKPEPEPEAKMEPKPERRAKPAPARKPAKAEAVKTPQPKAVQQGTVDRGAAQGASDAAGTALVPGKAAASMPGAAGSAKVEPDKSAALAVLLQGRRSGAEGTCRLLVHVASDGRVSACSLSEGSGKAVLDAAAKRLGEKLVGLSVAQTGGFQVLIPVHYRLTDG